MTDHKKKGDFDQWQRSDKGGNKKEHGHAGRNAVRHGRDLGCANPPGNGENFAC